MAPPAQFFARVERFRRIGSTNDVVRGWLAGGVGEVCLAVADEQTEGRGRHGRTWQAPPGSALLLSVGFRPAWLAPEHAWRLGAVVAIAMCDAAEDVAGLPTGSIRLKWPNDLVIEVAGPRALLLGPLEAGEAATRLAGPLALRKLAGVLGESDGLGTPDPRVVVGIGVNAGLPAAEFPAELAGSMTSLHEASGGRPVDTDELLDGFTDRLEARVEALRAGYFDLAAWTERQATTGRLVTLEGAANEGGTAIAPPVRSLGVDAPTGALVVEDPAVAGGERLVHAGEVVHVRLVAEGV